jgi:predicted house-cleaning noncanonical NTP pyrophosphatase (MazG superfamily)
MSRDDAEVGFLGSYLRDQVIATNPFEHLDREGVGRVLRLCIDEARSRRPDIPIGLGGEHACDAASVEYPCVPGSGLPVVFAATGTAGPVQCWSRRAHAIDDLAGLSGRFGLLRSVTILLCSVAMSGDTTLRGKLVRDRIPEIILRKGLVPIVETASPQNYDRYVRAKLEEELAEYLSSGDVAELADLVEVCFAAAALHGVGPDELLAIARDKRQQRGGFDDRLVWMGNLPRRSRESVRGTWHWLCDQL